MRKVILFLILPVLVSACSRDTGPADIYDPYEQTNRELYNFNMSIEKNGLRPGVKAYNTVMPRSYTSSFVEFFSNLEEPVTLLNNLLQADFSGALATTTRFAVNSTLGFFGLFDVAEDMGLPRNRKRFGHTFGVWGIGSGPYLVPPLYRPISTRELVGKGFDMALDPLSYTVFYGMSFAESAAMTVGDVFTYYADNVELVEQLEQASVDPYATLKSLYYQSTYNKVQESRLIDSDRPKEKVEALKKSGKKIKSVPKSYDVEMDFDDE